MTWKRKNYDEGEGMENGSKSENEMWKYQSQNQSQSQYHGMQSGTVGSGLLV